eukprot:CAMPEP_0117464484 /NCGR_PEP_ID=MMETSP0784-20121206/4125_1 /TAXON_ID=39447 /ORGANISM="" /LENGTH=60 /DNA_ID=CAMNT_0005258345 /DNA_START=117 /DNA_END=299 /DNA_ORIENTATION=+
MSRLHAYRVSFPTGRCENWSISDCADGKVKHPSTAATVKKAMIGHSLCTAYYPVEQFTAM